MEIIFRIFRRRSESWRTRAALAWVNRNPGQFGTVQDWLNERERRAYHQRGA